MGDNIGYAIGRYGGYTLVRRYGAKVRLDEAKLKVGMLVFDRHGGKVVFFGRFVSVLRTYAAFLAGVNQMRYPRFLVFNAAAGSFGRRYTPSASTSPAARSAAYEAPSTSRSEPPRRSSWSRSSFGCATTRSAWRPRQSSAYPGPLDEHVNRHRPSVDT